MAVKTTYVEVAGDISKYERSMNRLKAKQNKVKQYLKDSWMQIGAAILAAHQAWDLMNMAARAEQEAQAFANLAASYGTSADQILHSLKRASAGTVDTMTLIQKAGTAMMMGIAPEKVSKLMEIARATSKMTGQTVSKAFEDISLAVGRQSRMILDNLGIIVKVSDANENYAKQLGKTASQLTDVEKKQAFMNATIDAGEDLMKRMGKQTKTTAEWFQSMSALAKNVTVGIGQFSIKLIRGIMIVITLVATTINQTLEQITRGWSLIFGLFGKLPGGELLGFKALSQSLQEISEYFRQNVEWANQFNLELLEMGKAGATVGFTPPGGGPPGEEEDPLKKIKEQAFKDDMARLGAALDAESEYIEKGLQMEVDRQERMKELKMQAYLENHAMAAEMFELGLQQAAEYAEKQKKIEFGLFTYKQGIQKSYITFFGASTNALAKIAGAEGKKLFVIQKTIEVGMATANAFLAYTAALANPTPMPPGMREAYAASVLKMGLMGAAAIAATAIGELAGGGGVGVGAGGAAVTPVAPVSPVTGLAAQQEGGRPQVNIHIEGDMLSDEYYIEKLAEKISEAVEDRDVYIVSTRAKEAERLT